MLGAELVRGDLLQELDGRERAMVHRVLADDVPRSRVALEVGLEARELGGEVVGGGASSGAGSVDDRTAVGIGPARTGSGHAISGAGGSSARRRHGQHREANVDLV